MPRECFIYNGERTTSFKVDDEVINAVVRDENAHKETKTYTLLEGGELTVDWTAETLVRVVKFGIQGLGPGVEDPP